MLSLPSTKKLGRGERPAMTGMGPPREEQVDGCNTAEGPHGDQFAWLLPGAYGWGWLQELFH